LEDATKIGGSPARAGAILYSILHILRRQTTGIAAVTVPSREVILPAPERRAGEGGIGLSGAVGNTKRIRLSSPDNGQQGVIQ